MITTRVRVLVVVAAATITGLAAQSLYADHPLAATVIDDGAQLVAGVLAVLSCVWFGWRETGPERVWRWFVGAGFLGWTAGMAVWAWYREFGGIALPSPSLADVGFLTLPVFGLVGLLVLATNLPSREPAEPATPRSLPRVVLVLDGLMVVCSLFILTWATALGAVVKAGAPTPLELAVAIAYPASDLVLVTIVVLLIVLRRVGNRRRLLVLGLGMVALSLSDSFFAYLVSRGAADMAPIFDVGFIAGPALIALAAADRTADRPVPKPPGRARAVQLAYLFLPYTPLAATGLLLLTQVLGDLPIDAIEQTAGAVVITLAIARQLTILLENTLLLEKVRDSQARLHYQAFHDSLTGLANRALFHERLSTAVERHRHDGRPLGLLFVDLDDFKLVNDSLGHEAGDMVLCMVAQRLRDCAHDADMVARLGGDEFAVLLAGAGDPQQVGQRILDALRNPVHVAGRSVLVSASVGAAATVGVEPDLTPDAFLRRVDTAMYGGKQAGKGILRMHPADRLDVNHADLLTLLAAALQGDTQAGSIEVNYQPIVRMADGAVVALEALARWASPVFGAVPPQVFVAAAERAGLISELDDLILDLACRDATSLPANSDGEPLRFHVNVSATRIGCPTLEGAIRAALARHHLPGDRLVVEITETRRLADLGAAAQAVRRIQDMGVSLALDDFGAGYQALSHLHALPVDVVKLDRVLTTLDGDEDRSSALGRSLVGIAHDLGVQVIAEGIESDAQVRRLTSWGCDLGQGYLFGYPNPLAGTPSG
ncbi:MAG: EAL domain-containing protein [Hamadaea sp.]|uniref:putative bifunctional diguanylate cyclase/phosphodiesterase n=1 Tax=Hamadaea sp. TaxID=2024425 RepID=UPI0017A6BF61|nr:EAL domain-containing protein [Hamadaea sp.]NUT20834.1 EAL domain-containing protein [Hamadaea sp.]